MTFLYVRISRDGLYATAVSVGEHIYIHLSPACMLDIDILYGLSYVVTRDATNSLMGSIS